MPNSDRTATDDSVLFPQPYLRRTVISTYGSSNRLKRGTAPYVGRLDGGQICAASDFTITSTSASMSGMYTTSADSFPR